MTEAFGDPGAINGYHAHVYYAPETKAVAAQVREGIAISFPAAILGRWHDEAVGPHTVSMYQVAFGVEDFPRLVPWLMLNHAGLDVLIHPQTGDSYEDHTANALWLGDRLPLKLDRLRRRTEG
ncbi:MAG TPA: DOPA 4,5-dioxygenase family protein [Stellaceae bacterium]|nr:DOPA 4,5-dioxygenase family protein [Stellaceae bacterium]